LLDRLYAIPAGAEHHARLGRLTVSASAANVDVWARGQNGSGLAFLLQCAGLVSTPGAAQYLTNWHVELQWPEATGSGNDDTAGILYAEPRASTVAATAYYAAHAFEGGGIVIPPRYWIVVNGRFNAGAAANAIDCVHFGWYMPRGNLAYP